MNNIIRLDKVKFNLDELVEYYYTLERDFQHIKWHTSMIKNKEQLDAVNWYSGGTCYEIDWSGWCIQETLHHEEGDIECPWRVGASPTAVENSTVTRRSVIAFGIAEKFLDNFPDPAQMALVIHPPGAQLVMHRDDTPEDINNQVIQIPIISNDKAYWIEGDGTRTVLKPGHAYMVNTWEEHGTLNEGDTPRVHIKFSIHKQHVNWLLNTGFDIS